MRVRAIRPYLDFSVDDESHLPRADLWRDDHISCGKGGWFKQGDNHPNEPGDLREKKISRDRDKRGKYYYLYYYL